MSYKQYGCEEAYNIIVGRLSKNSKDFKKDLKHLLNTGNDYLVYQGSLNAPTSEDVMKQVIGRGGCYFKRTTYECDIDFIWHDREKNKIEFWGPKKNLNYAMQVIQSRIDKISKAQLETKCLEKVNKELNLDLNEEALIVD
jgi:hypothetical protein